LLLLILVVFLLSNRSAAMLGFWPFGFALVIGFLGGLAAHLPKRFAAHRRANKAEKRAGELEGRLAAATTSQRLQAEDRRPTIAP
jgi:uncharacterized integral membrane protein